MQERADRHLEHLLTMRAYLAGKNYFMAARALEFARARMQGCRKDGITPEFHHPLAVARWIRTLPPLLYSEETIAASFLHDLLEDDPTVTLKILQENFGELVATSVWILSKKQRGLVKSPDLYFEGLAQDPIASVVKGADRIHNIHTMWNVFTPEKQKAYL